MGAKSRGNFKLVYCMKVDCLNRHDDGCSDCFRFSNYEAVNEDGRKDEEWESQRKDAEKA
jgi:hypothetical protein